MNERRLYSRWRTGGDFRANRMDVYPRPENYRVVAAATLNIYVLPDGHLRRQLGDCCFIVLETGSHALGRPCRAARDDASGEVLVVEGTLRVPASLPSLSTDAVVRWSSGRRSAREPGHCLLFSLVTCRALQLPATVLPPMVVPERAAYWPHTVTDAERAVKR